MNRDEMKIKYPFLENPKNILITDGWEKRFLIPMLDDIREVVESSEKPLDFKIKYIMYRENELKYLFISEPEEFKTHMTAWSYIASHTCKDCGAFPVPVRKIDGNVPLCNKCLRKRIKAGKDSEYLDYLGIYVWDNYINDDLPRQTIMRSYYSNGIRYVEIDMMPFYEKIGYSYDENREYSKSFKEMPEECYEAFARDVVKNAEKIWRRYGEPVWDDLLNIEDPDDLFLLSGVYLGYFYRFLVDENYQLKNRNIDMLPHWYVFPEYPIGCIGYRMGTGEDYKDQYWDYFGSLSKEEKIEHRRKYPRPFFMDDECVFGEDEYPDEDEKELVTFVYRNRRTGELKNVNVRYLMFADLSREEKEGQFEEKRIGLACFLAGDLILKHSEMSDSREDIRKEYKKLLKQLEFVKWQHRQALDVDNNDTADR